MKQLYDQIDQYGNTLASGIILIPGLSLPEGHKWVPHVPSIESLRAIKKSEIELQRNQSCYMPINHLGYRWQADTRSQDLLSSAILLAELGAAPAPAIWRTLDNQDIPVTLTQLKEIAGLMAQQTQASYQHSWTLKELVNQANSQQELDSIVWSYYGG